MRDHAIFVVDPGNGGRWKWTVGEPTRDHPDRQLRFCKSFSGMGGAVQYVQCDDIVFLRDLPAELEGRAAAGGGR